jgi:hypothetical protein
MSENTKILKITQPQGVFYYEVSCSLVEANKGSFDDSLAAGRILEYVTVTRVDVPPDTQLRNKLQLVGILGPTICTVVNGVERWENYLRFLDGQKGVPIA